MNELPTTEYRVGLRNRHSLLVNKSFYEQKESITNSYTTRIQCDLEKKTMMVMIRNPEDTEYQSIDMSGYIEEDIIDLSDKGWRWEGSSLNGQPFGFGCYYSPNSFKVYEGFLYEGKKVCFGKEFFKDSNCVEYYGCFFNGMRFGFCCMKDLKDNIVFEGHYYGGETLLSIPNHCNDCEKITSFIQELTVGNYCYNDLSELLLEDYFNLKSLVIGDYCFQRCTKLIVSRCKELKVLSIGKSCSPYSDVFISSMVHTFILNGSSSTPFFFSRKWIILLFSLFDSFWYVQ